MALNGVNHGPANGTAVPSKPRTQIPITSGHNLNGLIYLMYARHNFVFCSAIIERCLSTGCDLEYPYYVKGLIARHEGRPAEAIKYFQKAVEYNSTKTEYYREIAKTLYQIGRFKQSLEIFIRTETILVKRGDCEIQYYIAKLLSKNISHGQLRRADAKEYFIKAIQGGRHLPSMSELAEIYVREGDFRKSIELLENSLQVNSDDVDVLTRMGILHLMSGDTQTALTKLLDALSIDGSSPKLLLALGGILQARGDADGALNKYKSIENLEGQGAELWSNLGLCFMKNQKIIAAISCLRKANWIAPLNFNGLFNLGYLFLKAKLYVSAFHIFATAINLKPNHIECMMLLGICLSELNDKRNAKAALEKAINLPEAEKYPLAYLNFAIFCYQSGIYGPSLMNLRRYLALVDNRRGSDQSRTGGHGTRNHLKVARKLMALLKLITNEPDDQQQHQEEGEKAVGGTDVKEGKEISVIAVQTAESDGVGDDVVKGTGPSGPSLGGSGSSSKLAADDYDDDVGEDNETNGGAEDGGGDIDRDSLEGGSGDDVDVDEDMEAGADYAFVTVFADVEKKIE